MPTPSQLTLPGIELPSPPDRRSRRWEGYKLFVALYPEPMQALAIAQQAKQWCERLGLNPAKVEAERLHVTLCVIGDFAARPPSTLIDPAIAALARLRKPSFLTRWDRVQRFVGSKALVLRCDESSEASIARTRDAVLQALADESLGALASAVPHMTLLYVERQVIAEAIEPIDWTARRLALVLSHVGKHRHEWLACHSLSIH